MRIALSGYYGFGNAGDDAIVLAILDQIEAVMPGAEVTIVTYPHGDVEAVTRLTGAKAVDGRDLGEVVEAIRPAGLLIVGGGGLVQDYLPADPAQVLTARHGNLAFWTGLALAARTAGVPVATWAIGIGPLSTPAGREQAGLLLGEAGLVCVRDGSSAELAGELGVPEERVVVAADPVFGLAPPETDPFERLIEVDDLPSDGSTRIVVSVRSWSGEERREGELASALDRLIEAHDADVLFLPFQQSGKGLDNDALVSTRVAARMRHTGRRAVISTPLSPVEKLGVTAHADLVIGMRLHSIMGAAAGGVPFVAIAYDPKVATAAAELGLADLVVDADPLSAGEVTAAAATALGLDAGRTEEYRRRGRALHDRARLAAPAIAGFAEHPQVPPIRPAVVDLLGSVAVERAVDLVRVEDERDRAVAAEGATALELEDLRTAYDKLAAEYQSFMDTKVVRAATSVWRARDGLRRLPSGTAAAARRAARRVLPPGARRVLRDAVGGAAVPARAELTPEELAVARARIDTDLARIIEAHAGAPGFVILPPGIGWDVELFQRPQQMALAFAGLGYPVLYHLDDRYRDGRLGFERREDGVYVGFVPDELTDLLHRIPSPIYLSYVYNFDWRRHLEHPVTVYEHIDHLEVFEHVYRRDRLEEWHARALEEAEVVAASAADLLAEVAAGRPDAVLVPNGVDYRHFAGPAPSEIPDELAGVTGPVVGYYGALAEWFDYELLAGVAGALPELTFVLIGPDYDGTASVAPALELPNVQWLGPRPYALLPAYLARFDVATIPFVVNEVTHAVSPLKLFEYMAGGKPVVTPPLRECARYRAVQIGEGVDGFVAAIRRALELGKDPEHVDLLRRTARANTWEARARTIIEAVERSRL